jgi:hypothetical protein
VTQKRPLVSFEGRPFDLAGRGRHRLGLANARREPQVEILSPRMSARQLQAPSTPVSAQVNPQTAITANSDAPGKASGCAVARPRNRVDSGAGTKEGEQEAPRWTAYESRGGLFGLLLGERHHTWSFSGG